MVRKIGNVALIFYMLFFSVYCLTKSIDIDVRILDERGTAIKKTGVGIPTILEVIVRGSSSASDKIYIEGLTGFEVEQRGTTKQLSTINGVTSTKMVYRYMIRANREGTYTIGPVYVQIHGTTYTSPSYVLEVQRDFGSSSTQKVALEVCTDKHMVVVGERIPISIRFYTQKDYELLGIDPLELQHCKMSPMKGPCKGVAQRNGAQQKYIEWQTDFVPQKVGELVIPALKAYYKEPMHSSNLHATLLGGLLDFGYTKKYTYSNAINIQVEPLPNIDRPIHAVGLFTSLQASLNQKEAKQGEGVVLSLVVEGEGDLDGIAHPQLQLPESLTYYESKATIPSSGTKKTFEYIVQGKKEGTCVIPCQEFVFFDVHDKTYKVLQTTPLSLTIIAPQHAKPDIKNEKGTSVEVTEQNVWPANEKNQPSVPYQSGLPPYLLWLGFMLPCIIWVVRGTRCMFRRYVMHDNGLLKKRQAFNDAKKKIEVASKSHDTAQLYTIFIVLAANRYGVDQAQLSQDMIRQKLVRLSQATVVQWDAFFLKITEQAYAYRHLTLQEKEELFKGAFMWLTLFQKSEIL